jgi:hypothetical protein
MAINKESKSNILFSSWHWEMAILDYQYSSTGYLVSILGLYMVADYSSHWE